MKTNGNIISLSVFNNIKYVRFGGPYRKNLKCPRFLPANLLLGWNLSRTLAKQAVVWRASTKRNLASLIFISSSMFHLDATQFVTRKLHLCLCSKPTKTKFNFGLLNFRGWNRKVYLKTSTFVGWYCIYGRRYEICHNSQFRRHLGREESFSVSSFRPLVLLDIIWSTNSIFRRKTLVPFFTRRQAECARTTLEGPRAQCQSNVYFGNRNG